MQTVFPLDPVLERSAYSQITFDVVDLGYVKAIQARLIVLSIYSRMSFADKLLEFFNAISIPGRPMLKYQGDDGEMILEWLVPHTLAQFLYDKFDKQPQCDVRSLKGLL